jgi:hypothetical protein
MIRVGSQRVFISSHFSAMAPLPSFCLTRYVRTLVEGGSVATPEVMVSQTGPLPPRTVEPTGVRWGECWVTLAVTYLP